METGNMRRQFVHDALKAVVAVGLIILIGVVLAAGIFGADYGVRKASAQTKSEIEGILAGYGLSEEQKEELYREILKRLQQQLASGEITYEGTFTQEDAEKLKNELIDMLAEEQNAYVKEAELREITNDILKILEKESLSREELVERINLIYQRQAEANGQQAAADEQRESRFAARLEALQKILEEKFEKKTEIVRDTLTDQMQVHSREIELIKEKFSQDAAALSQESRAREMQYEQLCARLKEINEGLAAQLAELNGHFAEQKIQIDNRFTEQAAGTASRFAAQEERLNQRDSEVNNRFAEQETQMDNRFTEQAAGTASRFAAQEERLNQRDSEVNNRFAEQEAQMDNRFTEQEGRLSQMIQAVKDELAGQISNLLARIVKNEKAIAEVFQLVSNGKALIASAITDGGIGTARDAEFEIMAANIRKLSVQKYNDGVDAAEMAADCILDTEECNARNDWSYNGYTAPKGGHCWIVGYFLVGGNGGGSGNDIDVDVWIDKNGTRIYSKGVHGYIPGTGSSSYICYVQQQIEVVKGERFSAGFHIVPDDGKKGERGHTGAVERISLCLLYPKGEYRSTAGLQKSRMAGGALRKQDFSAVIVREDIMEMQEREEEPVESSADDMEIDEQTADGNWSEEKENTGGDGYEEETGEEVEGETEGETEGGTGREIDKTEETEDEAETEEETIEETQEDDNEEKQKEEALE